MHGRSVEGFQIVVVKAWSLAELSIPGLECFCCGFVFDDILCTGSDLLHFLEIGNFHRHLLFFGGHFLVIARRQYGLQIAKNVGPAVAHQIFLLIASGGDDVEIIHALLVPARFEIARPCRVGRCVAAGIDRGGRALEHIQLFGGRAQVGNALYRCRAGADDTDAFVGQFIEAAFAAAAGIVIVPSAGVEGVAFECVDTWDSG